MFPPVRGTHEMVGAANNSGQGAAYVFARGPHEWSQRQKLTANDSAPNDQFGVSVAVSGNGKAALVGAHFNNGNRGAAYVFAGGPHGWSQTQKLTASDAAPFDQLGASVSLSGDGREALVGAVGNNGFRGAAYLYARGPHGWSQQQKFVASDAVAGDLFGDAVALSGDGHSALVGANDKSSAQGAAYVFARGPHSWSQRQELTASDGAAGDNFGLSVALNRNGKTALVGAPDPFLTTTGEGAAYAYSLE